MKRALLILSCVVITIAGQGQSKTFSKDAQNLETNMKNWTLKNGYRLLIKFDLANNASFYAQPNQDYAIFYIYDIDLNIDQKFVAYLMTPTDSLRNKYTAHPTEIAKSGTAGGQVLQFSTNKQMIGGASKLPVKMEAAPKSRMYVYRKTRKEPS
jgi:hypothetical protein